MINSFRCKRTQSFFEGKRVLQFLPFQHAAARKLQLLDTAVTLDFLRAPPGNRLEALDGNRAGQYSIRINDQWRICFLWTSEGPEQVEIIDYH